MATEYKHVQLGVVKENGDVDVLFPINNANDVDVALENNPNVPNNVRTLQHLTDELGQMAFKNGTDIIYFEGYEDDSYNDGGETPGSEINDERISDALTWSSRKISTNTICHIPNYELNTTDLTALFITPTTFVVDGTNLSSPDIVPANGFIWFVEYIPMVTSSIQVSGQPSGINTVTKALQRWTGHTFADANAPCVVFTRVFKNNAWGAFNHQ